MQRILAQHKGIGIEKCGVRATINTAPSCFPGKLKIEVCNYIINH
jgi:hypothetical protein